MLSAVFSHPLTTLKTAAQALRVYSRIRQLQATEVTERSRSMGLDFAFYSSDSDDTPDFQDVALRIQQRSDETDDGDPVADMQQALTLLEQELGGQM